LRPKLLLTHVLRELFTPHKGVLNLQSFQDTPRLHPQQGAGMLTRPDITRPKPRPRPEGPRPRPSHRGRGRGRKVYRYGHVNDSCNYVTYVGYVIKKCRQNRATYKTVVTTTVIVKVPCSSDHIQRAKLHFKSTRLWLSNRMNDRSSPRPNIMQVVNESVYLKKSFSGRWASAFASFHSRPRPHTGGRGRSHLLEAEAAKNWPRGLTSKHLHPLDLGIIMA